MKVFGILSTLLIVCGIAGAVMSLPPRDAYPQVVAHRGASGYLPEHSLQAYQLAIDLKADYIEPDLCITKDGAFIAMHDVLLDDTTNVASFPEFANRKTTKDVEGTSLTGYFVSDFTLSEIKQLTLKQRLYKTRSQLTDGYFAIPTFDEIMSLAQSTYSKTGRMIGIYPEMKHPDFHRTLGFPMVDMFLTSLTKGGYEIKGENVSKNLTQVVPVLVQCFSPSPLVELSKKCDLPLLQLIDKTNASSWTEEKVKEIASYATVIGPEKSFFEMSPSSNGATYENVMETMALIRSYDLYFHPWTLRADQDIGTIFNGNFAKEQMYFYCCLGTDGMFTEFPDQTREIIDIMKDYQKQFPGKCPINCENP
jgi:glycerophosphoryl diester phosphodiesterase